MKRRLKGKKYCAEKWRKISRKKTDVMCCGACHNSFPIEFFLLPTNETQIRKLYIRIEWHIQRNSYLAWRWIHRELCIFMLLAIERNRWLSNNITVTKMWSQRTKLFKSNAWPSKSDYYSLNWADKFVAYRKLKLHQNQKIAKTTMMKSLNNKFIDEL